MQTIKTTFKLEEKDFVNYQMQNLIGGFVNIAFMFLVLVAFCYLWYNYSTTGKNFNFMMLTGLAVASYIASFVYFIPKGAKQAYKTSAYKDRQVEFEADEQGVKLNRGEGRISLMPWDSFKTVWSNKDYFFFNITDSNFIQLPKRFLSQANSEALNALIILKVKHSKRRNPNRRSMIKQGFTLIVTIGALLLIVFSILSLLGIVR